MAGTPMTITLYDENSEVVATYTRTIVPWRLLKGAVKLQKSLDPENMTEADVDMLAGLVCEVFGNKFSIEQLNDGADIGEMMVVLQAIISKAVGAIPNGLPGRS